MKILVHEWLLGNVTTLEPAYDSWLNSESGKWVSSTANEITKQVILNPENVQPYACLKIYAEFSDEDAAWFELTWASSLAGFTRIKKLVLSDRFPEWC